MADYSVALAERTPLPDFLIRLGMRKFIRTVEAEPGVSDETFAREMATHPIAEHADLANRQHYALPPAFFSAFLGRNRKYSCCFYPTGRESLNEAEVAALRETESHAQLKDGLQILELGCGWGSLSLWMAQQFPRSHITAVSNSPSQRSFIVDQAKVRGLQNLTVITADMNLFEPKATFDRIVSIEMFEHMANWYPLLARARGWLNPGGKLFLHVFTHPSRPSRYEPGDGNWMSEHFFTGGIMPSQTLIRQFSDLFTVCETWRWSGTHYQRTAEDWLDNFDRNSNEIEPILAQVYGSNAALWRRRWRMFLLATAESFGFRKGTVWGVNHYLLEPTR